MDPIINTPPPPAPSQPLYAEPPPAEETGDAARRRALKQFGIFVEDADHPDPALTPPTSDPATPATPATPAATPATPAAGAPPVTPPLRPPNRLPTAQSIADAVAARIQPPAPEAPPVPEPEPVDAALDLRLSALDLVNKRPEFVGRKLRDEFLEYNDTKVPAYQAQWEKKNPGEVFDVDAAEHDQWRESNAPDIDEDLVKGAESGVQAIREIEQKLQERDNQYVSARIASEADTQSGAAQSALINFRNDIEATNFDELLAKDPLAATVIEPYINQAAALARAATEILTPGSPKQPNPADPAHRFVMDTVKRYEALVMQMPAEQRTDSIGRPYVTEDQYRRLTPVQRQHVWTFRYDPASIRTLIVADLSRDANLKYEARRGKAPAPTPASTPPPVPPSPIRPPSGGSGPATVPAVAPLHGSNRPHRSFFHED